MNNYLSLVARVLEAGQRRPNRTGTDTLMVPSASLSFDLREGFPAVTTKRLQFDACKGELLGFFRGYQSAAEFRSLQCRIWDANANETPSWVRSRHRRGVDDLGRIYGAQWTGWNDIRVEPRGEEARRLSSEGFKEVAFDAGKSLHVMHRSINQLEVALEKCKFTPDDRRILISAWRPDEFDLMALPPCHVLYQFLPVPAAGELHMTMYQRSCDLFLGVPFNIASSALFLSIMARLSGLAPATLTLFLGDVHIYVNHLDQVKEQLTRAPHALPRLLLGENIRQVEDRKDVAGAFTRMQLTDIALEHYQHWPALAGPMAA